MEIELKIIDFGEDYVEHLDEDESEIRDMEIKLTNNEILKVHKSILSRNEVFQAMLDSQMIESKEKRIEITDCDPEAFKTFLTYLYTGEYPYGDISLDLLMIAEKFANCDLELKGICFDELCDGLSMDNIVQTAQVAIQNNFEKLLKACQEFVFENYTELIGTPQLDAIFGKNPLVTGIIQEYREKRERSWYFTLCYREPLF